MIYTSDIVRVSVNRPVAIDTHYKILEWCNENHISAEWINCQVVADKMHFFYSIPNDKDKTAFLLRWL